MSVLIRQFKKNYFITTLLPLLLVNKDSQRTAELICDEARPLATNAMEIEVV